ncbi:uncharacterized protein LOC104583007 [Brachypodium distachyon]|uniref:uncharacterized protein LOC104583007 n=1 Tax=Brachypodium distachyon TaxID=15368 RepID=UPI0005300AD1|nr:uncharacterized protein LOC104583007 [Brachypodium distachyon]|eukprot:XP_010232952.1 uncharacterized protein LOC104583007 [Brachypodium distachyon]
MWQRKTTLILVLVLAAVSLRACTGTTSPTGKPLVTVVNIDQSTNLFTSPLNSGRPLVLDLSSAALSTACNTQTTKVSIPTTASCAAPPGGGVSGVAGLGPSPLSFSSQVASLERLPNKFALCLPGERPFDTGAAIFGGGPLFSPSVITNDESFDSPPTEGQDIAKLLSPEIPLRRLPHTGGLERCQDRPDGTVRAGGQNWTANPTKFVSRWVACFAFVRAKQPPSAGMPAVVIGGYNMAGRVVVFDQDRQNISFTPPINPKIYCGNAKFMPCW